MSPWAAAVVVGNSAGPVSLQVPDAAAKIMGSSVVGRERDGLVNISDRLIEFPFATIRGTSMAVGLHVFRIKTDRASEFGDRAVGIVLLEPRNAAGYQRLCVRSAASSVSHGATSHGIASSKVFGLIARRRRFRRKTKAAEHRRLNSSLACLAALNGRLLLLHLLRLNRGQQRA